MKVAVAKNAFSLIERCDNQAFKRYLEILKYTYNGKFAPAPQNAWVLPDHLVQDAIADLKDAGFHIIEVSSSVDYSRLVYVRWFDGYYRFRCAIKNDTYNFIIRNCISGLTEYDEQTCERKTPSSTLAKEIIERLSQDGFTFQIDESYHNAMKADEERTAAYENVPEKLKAALHAGVKPFAHQNRAFDFLEQTDGCAMLGSCMGSGKTFMSLSYAAANQLRVLVICPKIVRKNWTVEAKKFFPFFDNVVEIKSKRDLAKITDDVKLISMNYEFAARYYAELRDISVDLLIVDESHYVKNPKTKRYMAVSNIASRVRRKILLSGTVVKNGREELLPQIQILGENYIPSDFWTKPLGRLWHDMQSFYLAMPKHEILAFLPPKMQRKIEFDVDNPIQAPNSITQIMSYKHESAASKIDVAIAYIEDWLDSADDDAMIVFSEYIDIVNKLHEKFRDVSLIHTGELSQDMRERVKQRFQNGEAKILFATRPSLAVGANLTRANRVLFVDLPWTPADIEQAEDRAHRIGQTSRVCVDYLVASNSAFERELIAILSRKLKLSKALCEGRNLTDEERKLLETSTEKLLASAFGLS